jgi:hypothetical protein
MALIRENTTMNTADINTKLTDGYLGLLKNLSTNNKLDIISKLTSSMKTSSEQEHSNFYGAFGAWDKYESAEEIINSIQKARNFNRNIEEF